MRNLFLFFAVFSFAFAQENQPATVNAGKISHSFEVAYLQTFPQNQKGYAFTRSWGIHGGYCAYLKGGKLPSGLTLGMKFFIRYASFDDPTRSSQILQYTDSQGYNAVDSTAQYYREQNRWLIGFGPDLTWGRRRFRPMADAYVGLSPASKNRLFPAYRQTNTSTGKPEMLGVHEGTPWYFAAGASIGALYYLGKGGKYGLFARLGYIYTPNEFSELYFLIGFRL